VNAALNGNESEVKEILEENPNINVNWKSEKNPAFAYTALHYACYHSHDKVVSLLLAHPDIDVNHKDNDGNTPFMYACVKVRTNCVRLMLRDPRVNPNVPDNDGSTPLWCAASNGLLDNIKWWIASGRDIDLGQPGNEKTDAIWAAKRENRPEVATLLERFKENPEKTRSEVRKELRITGEWGDSFPIQSDFHFKNFSLFFLV